MIARRLVSGLLTLMAVQYAAVGDGPVCAASHHQAAAAEHTSPDHCPPASPDGHADHSSSGCLAMAGCGTIGLAAVVAVELSVFPTAMAPAIPASTHLRSVLTPPETPPPIT